MDIEKIKKLSKNATEAGRLVKAVTAFKNELKDKEQMHDITMSDHFKTLREPLIEQQKKTDEKQDRVIEQLKKNQLALTSGIQDIMTLNRDLPQITPEECSGSRELPAPKEKVIIADINKKFWKKDFEIITKKDLIPPSELLKLNPDALAAYGEKVTAMNKVVSYELAALRRTKTKDVSQEIKEKESEKETMESYVKAVEDVKSLQTYYTTPKKGKGIKYKQPKRQAYKIHDGGYGGLVTDVPRLFNEMKLKVFRGGELIYEADADKSLINLLTKRYNPKTKYSINAVRIFNDLNTLSNMPKHRSSGESRMVGSSVTYYNNANDLVDRIKVLIGSIVAGNNSPLLKNDLSQINDELLRINAIDRSLPEKFYQKYLS